MGLVNTLVLMSGVERECVVEVLIKVGLDISDGKVARLAFSGTEDTFRL